MLSDIFLWIREMTARTTTANPMNEKILFNMTITSFHSLVTDKHRTFVSFFISKHIIPIKYCQLLVSRT